MDEELLNIEDELRRHRDFLRWLLSWLDSDPHTYHVSAEIENFLRIVQP